MPRLRRSLLVAHPAERLVVDAEVLAHHLPLDPGALVLAVAVGIYLPLDLMTYLVEVAGLVVGGIEPPVEELWTDVLVEAR